MNIESIMSLSIPIIAIVMGIGIGMLSMFLDYRKKRDMFAMHHKERLAAIDKGMDVPPLPPEFFQDSRAGRLGQPDEQLRKGLFWLLVGVAVTVALYYQEHDSWLWGLVPVAVGIAKLGFYVISANQPAPRGDEQDGTRPKL